MEHSNQSEMVTRSPHAEPYLKFVSEQITARQPPHFDVSETVKVDPEVKKDGFSIGQEMVAKSAEHWKLP